MNVEARLRNQFEDAEAIPFPEGWRSLLNDCLGELDPGVEIKNIGLAGCGGGLSVRLDHETISGGRHAVCEAAVDRLETYSRVACETCGEVGDLRGESVSCWRHRRG